MSLMNAIKGELNELFQKLKNKITKMKTCFLCFEKKTNKNKVKTIIPERSDNFPVKKFENVALKTKSFKTKSRRERPKSGFRIYSLRISR